MKNINREAYVRIMILSLCVMLTITILAWGYQKPKAIEPVIIYVFLEDEEIKRGASTEAFIFVENPFEDAAKYEVKITLVGSNEKSILLLSGIFNTSPQATTNLNLRITPPSDGSWRVVVSALVIEPIPKYFMENWANLSVIGK